MNIFDATLGDITAKSLYVALRMRELNPEFFRLDGEEMPLDELNNDPILKSYLFSIANTKAQVALGRDAINCTQIATESGVVLSDDIRIHSRAEAVLLMTDVWLDTFMSTTLTLDNMIDLTDTKQMWLSFLRQQAGTVLNSKEMTNLILIQEIIDSELISEAALENVYSDPAGMSVAVDESIRSTSPSNIRPA